MDKIILDTSVLVKFFSPDERDKTADNLLDRFTQKNLYFLTLDIAIYELTNTLKLSKKATVDIVSANISDVLSMNMEIATYSHLLLKKGMEFMDKFNLTIYDSVFIALSEMKKIPLLTADYKHHKKEISKYILHYREWKS